MLVRFKAWRLVLAAAGLAAILAAALPAGHAGAAASGCVDPFPAQRDPANPLMLSPAPGANPLSGASFFVDGPAHGAAAGAIARLLGIDSSTPPGQALPGIADSESWAQFSSTVSDRLARLGDPAVTRQVTLLEKIASEPEVQRISSFSQGGGPGAIHNQAVKLYCHNFTADPSAIPIINTYFLHADLGGCASRAQIAADRPALDRRVNELADTTGNRPVVFLLETDALGSSSCLSHHGSLGAWEAALRYEVDRLSALPHTVIYVEGGYSDSNSPQYTARALNNVDIRRIRGFYTNDTHLNWTINEVRWAQKVSKLTHGAHFIVNTAQNGHGPKLNPHPVKQGVEALCNPTGRAIGPKPTLATGFSQADAFLWTSVPGQSGGSCNGGTPSGTFWTARAVELAAAADGRLGPGYPSRPY